MRHPIRYRWRTPKLLLPGIRRGNRFLVFWRTKRAHLEGHLRCSKANSLQTAIHSGACGFRQRRRSESVSNNHTKARQTCRGKAQAKRLEVLSARTARLADTREDAREQRFPA